MGPYVYARHLISGPRLPFTAVYLGSIIMTVYFAAGVSRTMLSQNSAKTLIDTVTAPFYHSDPSRVDRAAGSPDMVSCQLLPYG